MSAGARARTRTAASGRHRQRGVTLVVVLLLLLVTMLMALASVRTAGMEERMAGNSRDRMIAFQLAEATLRDAEAMISGDTDGPFRPLRPGSFTATCDEGLCSSAPGAPLAAGFTDNDWASAKGFAYGAATGATVPDGGSSAPRYVIEYQGTLQPIESGKPCIAVFLLTARARGASASADVILQSLYRHRVGECYAAL